MQNDDITMNDQNLGEDHHDQKTFSHARQHMAGASLHQEMAANKSVMPFKSSDNNEIQDKKTQQ